MTNNQIILHEMEKAGLDPIDTKVDTFAGWRRHSYMVKQGEKAAFKAKIWKPVKCGGDTTSDEKMILVTASFFTNDQVEENRKEVKLYADK